MRASIKKRRDKMQAGQRGPSQRGVPPQGYWSTPPDRREKLLARANRSHHTSQIANEPPASLNQEPQDSHDRNAFTKVS